MAKVIRDLTIEFPPNFKIEDVKEESVGPTVKPTNLRVVLKWRNKQ